VQLLHGLAGEPSIVAAQGNSTDGVRPHADPRPGFVCLRAISVDGPAYVREPRALAGSVRSSHPATNAAHPVERPARHNHVVAGLLRRSVLLRRARSGSCNGRPASVTNTINLLHLAEFPFSPLP
jgi:hypothetical protein